MVQFQYSTNHGYSWHLVYKQCTNAMFNCNKPRPPSEYYPTRVYGGDGNGGGSSGGGWRRITLSIPIHTVSL